MNKNAISTLRLPALEIRQGPRRTRYTFAVDGKELANFATISRIGRTEEHAIKGYQRPEVLSHIADIQQYLESSLVQGESLEPGKHPQSQRLRPDRMAAAKSVSALPGWGLAPGQAALTGV